MSRLEGAKSLSGLPLRICTSARANEFHVRHAWSNAFVCCQVDLDALRARGVSLCFIGKTPVPHIELAFAGHSGFAICSRPALNSIARRRPQRMSKRRRVLLQGHGFLRPTFERISKGQSFTYIVSIGQPQSLKLSSPCICLNMFERQTFTQQSSLSKLIPNNGSAEGFYRSHF